MLGVVTMNVAARILKVLHSAAFHCVSWIFNIVSSFQVEEIFI